MEIFQAVLLNSFYFYKSYNIYFKVIEVVKLG